MFDKYLHRAHRQTTLVDDLCENLAMAPISRHLSGTDGSKAASQSTIVGALKAIEAELRAGKVSLRERREALTLVGRVHELLLTSTRTKPIS